MKFTLSWLKEHLDTDAGLATIVETLTRIGLEVEHVEDKAEKLKPFIIAQILEAEQHPNADRLRVCKVDTGEGTPLQVVCGAPNARAGLKTVFSPPGTYIPGKDFTIAVGNIRGVESHGMMCSEAELELSAESDGIIELPAGAPVGVSYPAFAGLDDPVIEINLTPNRPDCTSIHGIARDLAAAGIGTLKDTMISFIEGAFPCPQEVVLSFAPGQEHFCPAFGLRLVRGVKNGPSPQWMQDRLRAIGLRPINALVDITNYMAFDRGRPLHVFDAAKVHGPLVVRRSKPGESLLALDGRVYGFTGHETVISDDNGIESIAGIMGGEVSGSSEDTVDVLIESALWDPIDIARTGRQLGIVTDARYRFERGIDPAFCLPGLELATRMVLDFCGGSPSEVALAGDVPEPNKVVHFNINEVKRLTGITVSTGEIKRILSSLGFWMSGNGPIYPVVVPSWRPDVQGKADIVEEVIRIVGLDNVPPVPLDRGATVTKPILTLLQKRTRQARRALASRGMMEGVTWSFVSAKEAAAFGGGQDALKLANPIASDLSDMRPSLLPGLLLAAQRNADRSFRDVALFEVGQVFKGARPQDQFVAASGVRRGLASGAGTGRHWSGAQAASVFDVKADALAVLAAANGPAGNVQVVPGGPDWFHPGRCATLQLGPQNVFGHFGEIHPRLAEEMGLDGPLLAFEILLDAIPAPKAKPTRVKPPLVLSPLQPVERDFAFIVARETRAADILKAAAGVDKQLIADVTLFDLYEGKGIEPGKKSVGVSILLQPKDKTLTDAEIDAVGQKLVAEVTKKTGAVLRG